MRLGSGSHAIIPFHITIFILSSFLCFLSSFSSISFVFAAKTTPNSGGSDHRLIRSSTRHIAERDALPPPTRGPVFEARSSDPELKASKRDCHRHDQHSYWSPKTELETYENRHHVFVPPSNPRFYREEVGWIRKLFHTFVAGRAKLYGAPWGRGRRGNGSRSQNQFWTRAWKGDDERAKTEENVNSKTKGSSGLGGGLMSSEGSVEVFEVGAGGSSLKGKVSSGGGEAVLVQVTESTSQLQSPAGMVTQKCLTLVSDPTQKFCQTLLNGVNIGSDGGIPSSSSSSSSQSAGSSNSNKASTTSIANNVVSSSSVPIPTSLFTSSGQSSLSSTISLAQAQAQVTSSTSSQVLDGTVTATTTSDSIVTPSSSASSILAATDSSTFVQTASLTSVSAISPGLTSTITQSATQTTALATNAITQSITASTSVIAAADQTQSMTASLTATTSLSSGVVAAQAAASTPAVVIPGTQLQVLPIGLGIFGGLLGLTLIIVGYVMYERRKYKMQFRKRKLAEKGAPMGTSYVV